MKRSFNLLPPAGGLIVLVSGIALVSIPAALIVAGALVLAAWVAYFVHHVRRVT